MANTFNPEFEFTEKQAECWQYLTDDTTREIGYGGGAGGGKSWIGTCRIWLMANSYPRSRWFLGRRELSNLMKTTVNTYYKIGQFYNIPTKLMGKLDKKYNIIRFENGSEILLLDCATQPADPLFTRFGSLELTGGFIDESNEIDEQAITILKTRIGRQNNFKIGDKTIHLIPKILQTFNPDQGHIKRNFYTPWKTGTLPEYRKFVPSLVTDNDYIDPEYIIQLKNSTDEITKQRLLYGNFDWSGEAGKLFRHDEIEDLFETNIEKKEITYISVDVARLGDDKTVICIRRGLECIKILHYDRNTLDETANRIRDLEDMYGVPRRNIVIDSDGVGGGLADLLRGCTNFVNNSRPYKFEAEKKGYIIRNYANLKAQCYFKLKEMMEKRMVRVYADGVIRDKLSEELENIFISGIDTDGKVKVEDKKELKRRINRSPDFADAIMFRMIYLVQELEQESEVITGTYEIDYDSILY